jgi:hypothetical protein
MMMMMIMMMMVMTMMMMMMMMMMTMVEPASPSTSRKLLMQYHIVKPPGVNSTRPGHSYRGLVAVPVMGRRMVVKTMMMIMVMMIILITMMLMMMMMMTLMTITTTTTVVMTTTMNHEIDYDSNTACKSAIKNGTACIRNCPLTGIPSGILTTTNHGVPYHKQY